MRSPRLDFAVGRDLVVPSRRMLFEPWGSGDLWLNPPVELFNQALDKVEKDHVHAVLVVR